MKCIAAVDVDFERSAIGTKSRLADDIAGEPVLTRTLRRIASARLPERLFVLCPENQIGQAESFVPTELRDRVDVRRNRIDGVPFRNLVRTARKWSLDGWRGGLGGTCTMDEYTRSDELAILAHEQSADAVFCASAAAPLIDPRMIDTMIDHAEKTRDEARMTFVQAPPGVVGAIYQTDLLMEMGRQHVPPGMVLSYKPDAPAMDLALKSCCYTASEAIRHATGRLIVDTDRALEVVRGFINTGRPTDAETICRRLIECEHEETPELPREVEIELTTEDQLAETVMRPRGHAVGRRGPIDTDLVAQLAGELSRFDDSLVVLGGFGEPLLHPRFPDVLRILRDAGIYGIAVRTNGLALSDEIIDALIETETDVLNVVIDAWTPETYAAVHGANRLEEVRANLTKLSEKRSQCHVVAPLIVPELTKSVDTLEDIDPFFDGWIRVFGWANIAGYSHFSRRLPDRTVMSVVPPTRFACRRIRHRAMVLADGSVPACDQDFGGAHPCGSLADSSLQEIWQGSKLERLRRCHADGEFAANPLCAACDEWHRP